MNGGAYFSDANWLADDTATEDAMTKSTAPKPPSTTKVAFCSECFSKQMIMCRKDDARGRPIAYWLYCSDCAAETIKVPTLAQVVELTLWVSIDAMLE